MSESAEDIERLASEWIVRQQSGEWAEADQIAFNAWIDASIAHRIAYVRLDAMWVEAGRLKAIAAGVRAGAFPARGAWGARSGGVSALSGGVEAPVEPQASEDNAALHQEVERNRSDAAGSRGRYWAIAAALVMAVIAVWYVPNPFSRDRYVTQVGDIDQITLQDGSSVTLNTDTRISVAFEKTERRVKLDRGEAFFRVEKEAGRPFIVTVGDERVVVVGTQFSVRREDDGIRVAVTEGKVRVEAAADTPESPSGGSGGVLLPAGSLARTRDSEVFVNEQAVPEVERVLSWRSGYVVFHETTLADAVAEFNRFNTRKIVIEDPAVAAIRVGGKFKATNTRAFLWMLQGGFPIEVNETDRAVVLKAR